MKRSVFVLPALLVLAVAVLLATRPPTLAQPTPTTEPLPEPAATPSPGGIAYPAGIDLATSRRRYDLIQLRYAVAQEEITAAWEQALAARRRLEQRLEDAIVDSTLTNAECNRGTAAYLPNMDLVQYHACLCLAQWQVAVNGIGKMRADEPFDTFISAAHDAQVSFSDGTRDLAPNPDVFIDEEILLVEEQRLLFKTRTDLTLKLMEDALRMKAAYISFLDTTYVDPLRQALRDASARLGCGFQLRAGGEATCRVASGRAVDWE